MNTAVHEHKTDAAPVAKVHTAEEIAAAQAVIAAAKAAGTDKKPEVQAPPGHFAASFHFRTEKIRNEKGEEIGVGKKLPDVNGIFPEPTDEDLINFIANGGKEKDFLRDVIREAIKDAARAQINAFREENPDTAVTPNVFDLSKLTFSSIASMDARDRAKEIPEEVYNSFYEDYKAVLVALGTPAEKVNKHIVLFKSQFRTCRYDKPALGVLKERLNMYAAKTENMDDNAEVYGVLTAKIDKYLKADEKNLVAAL